MGGRARQAHVEQLIESAGLLGQLAEHDDLALQALEASDGLEEDHVVGLIRDLLWRQPQGTAVVVEGLVPQHAVAEAASAPDVALGRRTARQHRDAEAGHLLLHAEPVQDLAQRFHGGRTGRRLHDLGWQALLAVDLDLGSVIAEPRGQACHRGRIAMVLEQLQPLEPQLAHHIGPE